MGLITCYDNLFQLGYVARDLDRATDFLVERLGVTDFVRRDDELSVLAAGQPRTLRMRVAIAQAGNKQIEVIQPVSGATGIYTDGIDYDRSILTFHHVGIAVPGPLEAWTAIETDVRRGGDDFALAFATDSKSPVQVRFGYVDTRPYYGHYTEYLWWSEGTLLGSAAREPVAVEA